MMILSKPTKSNGYKLYQRKSLLNHFKSERHSYSSFKKRSRTRHLIENVRQSYQSICLVATLIFRLFIFIDRLTRGIFTFVEQIIQIIRVVYGWIQMIRAILSSLHLIASRLMLITSHIHRLCHLLSILFQPLSNGKFQQSVRSFSHCLFYYYSSNGACYTLQARTRHIAGRVKARWTEKHRRIEEEDIYYDTFQEEYQWF